MGRHSTIPALFEDGFVLDISILLTYTKPTGDASGCLTMKKSISGRRVDINYLIRTATVDPFVLLQYTKNNNQVKEIIKLQAVQSNLGKGLVWYFICPYTGLMCRKLYCLDKYFRHRKYFEGVLYEKQTYSRKCRQLFKAWGKELGFEAEDQDHYNKVTSKYFKKFYRGKITKPFASLIKKTPWLIEMAKKEVKKKVPT